MYSLGIAVHIESYELVVFNKVFTSVLVLQVDFTSECIRIMQLLAAGFTHAQLFA